MQTLNFDNVICPKIGQKQILEDWAIAKRSITQRLLDGAIYIWQHKREIASNCARQAWQNKYEIISGAGAGALMRYGVKAITLSFVLAASAMTLPVVLCTGMIAGAAAGITSRLIRTVVHNFRSGKDQKISYRQGLLSSAAFGALGGTFGAALFEHFNLGIKIRNFFAGIRNYFTSSNSFASGFYNISIGPSSAQAAEVLQTKPVTINSNSAFVADGAAKVSSISDQVQLSNAHSATNSVFLAEQKSVKPLSVRTEKSGIFAQSVRSNAASNPFESLRGIMNPSEFKGVSEMLFPELDPKIKGKLTRLSAMAARIEDPIQRKFFFCKKAAAILDSAGYDEAADALRRTGLKTVSNSDLISSPKARGEFYKITSKLLREGNYDTAFANAKKLLELNMNNPNGPSQTTCSTALKVMERCIKHKPELKAYLSPSQKLYFGA